MVVDAEVYRWTITGMRRMSESFLGVSFVGWIRVSDAEKLLEEAHARGKKQAQDELKNQNI